MGFDSHSLKTIDTLIYKGYSKVADVIEEEIGYLYTFTSMSSIAGDALTAVGMAVLSPTASSTALLTNFLLYGSDHYMNAIGLCGKLDRHAAEDDVGVLNPEHETYKTINRFVRFPTVLAGAGLLIMAGYDVIESAITGKPVDPQMTRGKFILGSGLLCHASSIYMKDDKTKRLGKIWDGVKNWIGEALQYKPALVPVAVKPETSNSE